MAKKRTNGKRGKYRSYSDEQRRKAVSSALKMGAASAARAHKISASTLGNWVRAHKAGLGENENASAAPATGDESHADRNGRTTGSVTPSSGRKGKRAAKRYTPSQRAEILAYASQHGPSAAAREFKVSRFSIAEWRKKVQRAATGQGSSPISGPDPAEVEAQRDREILSEWRRQPGLGPSQIRNQLRRRDIKVSLHTVRRVMVDAGYRPPKVERTPHDERYEAVRPNQLWHLDCVHRHINRVSTYTLILLDDYSRYVVGHGVDDAERADLVIRTFELAVERHGKPEMVLHDRGTAFWSWRGIGRFTALLTEYGVDQVATEHKESNGKLEAFNANLHKELFDVQRFWDVAEMRRRLAAHLHWYNHVRTHHALGGLLVPADRYYGRIEEVLARIEAGAGRDGLDSLQLHERCLELFKVLSRDGVAEVWLMGQRLLPPSGS